MKVKLNKNGRISKGRNSKLKTRHALEVNRQNNIIKRFSSLSDKSRFGKAMYCIAGVLKQKTVISRESKSINQPVSRFCVATKKESRANYVYNPQTWVLESKPKEWIRLNYKEVNIVKQILKHKYL